MSRLLALLILAPLAFALSEGGEFARPIGDLTGSDATKAERARQVLLWRGTPALKELRAAAKAATQPDIKERIEAVIREIEKNEPHGLRFFVVEDPYEGSWFFVPLETQLVGVYGPLDDGAAAAMAAFAQGTGAADSTGARSGPGAAPANR